MLHPSSEPLLIKTGSESLTLRGGRIFGARFLLILRQQTPLEERENYVNISKVTTQRCLLYFCAQIYVTENIAVSVFIFFHP